MGIFNNFWFHLFEDGSVSLFGFGFCLFPSWGCGD